MSGLEHTVPKGQAEGLGPGPSTAYGHVRRRWHPAGRGGPGWGLSRRPPCGPSPPPPPFPRTPFGRENAGAWVCTGVRIALDSGCRSDCVSGMRSRAKAPRPIPQLYPVLHAHGLHVCMHTHPLTRTGALRELILCWALSTGLSSVRRGAGWEESVLGLLRADPKAGNREVSEQAGFLRKCRILGFHRESGSGQKNDSLRRGRDLEDLLGTEEQNRGELG